jgi:hypothetical protein
MGREAECEIVARTHSIGEVGPKGLVKSVAAYTDCFVIGARSDLPDGEYTVFFDRHILCVALWRGLWISRGRARRVFSISRERTAGDGFDGSAKANGESWGIASGACSPSKNLPVPALPGFER